MLSLWPFPGTCRLMTSTKVIDSQKVLSWFQTRGMFRNSDCRGRCLIVLGLCSMTKMYTQIPSFSNPSASLPKMARLTILLETHVTHVSVSDGVSVPEGTWRSQLYGLRLPLSCIRSTSIKPKMKQATLLSWHMNIFPLLSCELSYMPEVSVSTNSTKCS